MPRFERSSGRRDSRGGSGRGRDSRGGSGGRGRNSGFGRDRRERGPVEMTKVTCSECGSKCEVPFKPTTDKPIFCSDCFEKKGGKSRSSGGRGSGVDLTEINEKLDKIMKALDVE